MTNYSLIPAQVDGDDPITGKTFVRLQTEGAARRTAGLPVIAGNEAHGLLWRPMRGDWVLVGYLPGQGLTIVGPYSAPQLAVGRALSPGELRVSGELGIGRVILKGITAGPTVALSTNSSAVTLLAGNDATGRVQFTGKALVGSCAVLTFPVAFQNATAVLVQGLNAQSVALGLYATEIAAGGTATTISCGVAGTLGAVFTVRYTLYGAN